MPVCEITKTEIRKLEATSFAREGLNERYDLQRLLHHNIDIIAPGTLVIAEEFCQWEDSKRRIDLPGVDRAGKLVVIELKRTEDGGHMELQSLRYAAMVSAMTFSQAVDIYTDYPTKLGREENAESGLLSHMESRHSGEAPFGGEVRIILVSAEFSKEITTSVLWLNAHIVSRAACSWMFSKYDLTPDGVTVPSPTKRALVFEAVRFAIGRGVKPDEIAQLVPPSKWLSVEGDAPAEQFWSIIEQANDRQSQYSPKRYFCGENELFRIGGRTWSLSNQWSIDTISIADDLANRFPALRIGYAKSVE